MAANIRLNSGEGVDVGKNEYLRTNSQDESAGHGSGDTKKLLLA
jgi:hypothetical protein